MIFNSIKKILKSKKTRRIFFVFVFLFICYFAFSVGADCFADGTEWDTLTKITNFNTIASEVIKCVYVLLWPLIFVCGIALDNSLVYGSWLHLDAPLWSLRNIMKNIANFMLWWLVLFSILRNLLSAVSKSSDNKWAPFNIIKNTLISGILIQMSRFLVAAIIDLSSVLTISVWWLPMTVLKQNSEYSNRPVMSVSINVWSNVNGMQSDIYYTYGDHKVSDCLVMDNISLSWSYILWHKIGYLWDSYNDTGFYMDTWYCTLWWWPYRYNHMLSGDGWIYHDIYSIEVETGTLINKTYMDFNKSYRPESTGDLQVAIDNCEIIPVDESKIPQACKEQRYWPLSFSWDDEFFRGSNSDNTILYTVDNLIEKSKWFVWPLITIYSSLLDIQSFVDAGSQSEVETFISLLFKLVFFVILVAPLVWLAIVLIVRVWILWIVIAASPVLILVWMFWDIFKWVKDVLWEKFNLWNIIKLVFAPVIVTLAISLSLVFINAISSINRDGVQREQVLNSLWVEVKEDSTYSILGLVDIQLDTTLIWKWKDDFSYFITLLFASAIIRFFLIAALKMCGGVWDKVWNFIDKNFTDMLSNAPIIPIPWWGAVWWNQIRKAPEKISEKVTGQFRDISEKNMKESFGWLYNEDEYQQAKNLVHRIKQDELKSLSAAEIWILAPIFKTRDEKQLIQMANNIKESDLDQLVSSREQYSSQSDQAVAMVNNINTEWAKIWADKSTHTSADALQLTKEQLNIAVQNDETWMWRAEGMIWWAVHTRDWVFIVDIIQWTEFNPIYRIVDRETYEQDHFGTPVEKLDVDEFNKYKNSKDEKEQQMAKDMELYLKKMAESDKQFEELKKKNESQQLDANSVEAKQLNQLTTMFNEKYLEALKKLDGNSDRFTVSEQQQWQQK